MLKSLQIQKLQPYFNNQLKRLAKTPKIFSIDTGVLCHLLQINTEDEFNKFLEKRKTSY